MQILGLSEATTEILATYGGPSVVATALSAWLGRLWADRLIGAQTAKFSADLERIKSEFLLETETHKVRLKKSELLFQMEVSATSAFVGICRNIRPLHEWPDMESSDAYDMVASKFSKIETILADFLGQHGAVLDTPEIEGISICIGIAGQHKFDTCDSPEISTEANRSAEKMLYELSRVEQALINNLRNQVRN